MFESNRREFLKRAAGGLGGLAATQVPFSGRSLLSWLGNACAFASGSNLSRVEARYYQKLEHLEVECQICPRKCRVGDRERGYCGVRENRDGTYYTLVYGKPCSLAVDPIEKKPLFHYLPGSTAFSFATAGCNMNCKYCQNWDISQVRPEQTENLDLPPRALVKLAREKGAPIIASTYSEPIVFYEYVCDTAREGRRQGIRNVMITAGYIQPEPLAELAKVLDAVKVDLKAFTEKFYKEVVHGELTPVLETLKGLKRAGVWLEIVYLVVPTLNDQEVDLQAMCQWIKKELGPDVPLHFSRFTPMYLLKNLPPTPVSSLEKAHAIAKGAGLNYVYIGNVPGHRYEHTYCPNCDKVLIGRMGYSILANNIKKSKCQFCGQRIPGVWK
jgi:pyruvate formate lyase activating enzyme